MKSHGCFKVVKMFLELKKRFQAQAVWRKTMRQLIRVSMSDNASPLSASVMIKRALSQTVIAAPAYKGLKSRFSSLSFWVKSS